MDRSNKQLRIRLDGEHTCIPVEAALGITQTVSGGPSRSIKGFTSEILRSPNEHLTVIVLANLEDAHVVGPDLAAMVFGDPFRLPD